MLQDLKQAARLLLQTKGWTAVVLVSLALGIGANTALFTAVNGLLLQTIPVPDPENLVLLKWTGENDMVRNSSEYGFLRPYQGQNVRATVSYQIFQDLRKSNQTLTDIFTAAPIGGLNVIVDGSAEIATAWGISGNYFPVLRVPVLMGRTIMEDDDRPGATPVAVISHGYWRRRFASDPNILGKVVTMNNNQVTIIGVTPAQFTGIQRLGATPPDVTVPLALDAQLNPSPAPPPGTASTTTGSSSRSATTRLSQPTTWWLWILGRLKPGVTLEQVKGNLEPVFQQSTRGGMDSYMASLTDDERKLSTNQRERSKIPQLLVSSGSRGVYDFDTTTTRSATVLGVVVMLVLLIVCANVANLLLSRATTRQKEISVRLSMGATRWRLIRQLLTESVLLSCIGGMLGILVGYWSKQLLPFGQTVPMDWRVFAFVAGISVLTGVTFGVVPAFRATRIDLAGSLKEMSRSVSRSRTILSKGLLVLQVAVSLVLLIGAGLFLRTLENLRTVNVGFNPNNILTFRVNPQLNRYDPDRTALLYAQMKDALKALPGVRSVSLTRVVLVSGSVSSSSMYIQGRAAESNNVHMMSISPEFFTTMEIPLLAGRLFTEHDGKTSSKVAVINEAAARKYFPQENALGRRVGFSMEQAADYEIIGIVRDTKYNSVRDEAPPTFYGSYLQGNVGAMAFLVRTAGDPALMVDQVRAAVRQVDPNLPLTNVTTQAEQLEGRFAQERLFARAYSLFGGLALLLACIGLFGLMSYSVSRRTNEIGIRMALGAQRLDVVSMVLRESLLLVGIGVVVGLITAFAAGRLVATVLFGLAATDALTIAAAIAVMIAVSAIAGYLPARRASRVDPMIALHYE
ncbi:MAG: ABC transporter permease [Acidobacteria bacterium]|nr:ABC transporter permease [Acidobacteriota bacterium]